MCATPLPRPSVATAVLTPPVPSRGPTTPDSETLAASFVNPFTTGGAATSLVPGQTFGQRYQIISLLGVAPGGARQFREAIDTFTRGLASAPTNALLFRWGGLRYLSVRELDGGRDDLTRGAALDSTIYGIWYHLGIVRFVHGDFVGAADAFTRAQPRAPDAGELAGSTDWLWMALMRAGRAEEARAMLARRPDSLATTNAYARRLKLSRGEIGPNEVLTPADTADVQVATLSYGVGNWYLVRGDTAEARRWFERSVQSGGWPGFGFIVSEVELGRLRR